MKAYKPPLEAYLKYKTAPVVNNPFDPKTTVIAKKIIKNLKELLDDTEIVHMGSTALRISGKNDIEIYVFPNKNKWGEVYKKLTSEFGEAGVTEDDFARFNTGVGGYEVEIIMLSGYAKKLNLAMHKYLSEHKKALEEYEELKKKYSHSKREYQIQKDKFFAKIIKGLPEDYVSG